MAKRTRGTSRPGQRRPIQRPAGRAAPPDQARGDWTASIRPSGALTEEEEARAAEIEARLRAEERAAEEAERKARERARQADLTAARRDAVPLTVRAASEYAYVRRDIIRIGRVAGVLVAILAVLHVLINVAGVVSV